MEAPASGICIYLRFGSVTDDQREAFMDRLGRTLPIYMRLMEDYGQPGVWVEGPDDDAAFLAVDKLVKAVRARLRLDDDHVHATRDPHLLP